MTKFDSILLIRRLGKLALEEHKDETLVIDGRDIGPLFMAVFIQSWLPMHDLGTAVILVLLDSLEGMKLCGDGSIFSKCNDDCIITAGTGSSLSNL
jgi:hypothetical protein